MDFVLVFMVVVAIGLAVLPGRLRPRRRHLLEIDSTKAGDLLISRKREKVTV